jgi:hypothetical protein
MSWEALRLTSRTPAEVYHTLGAHGVEELLRDARNAVWREYPTETRSFEAVRDRLKEVYDRNLRIWRAIKKPTPEAFFANLLPQAADGHIRQALVLTWMMMPRAGGRELKDATRIVDSIFQRMLDNWQQDNATFTKGTGKKAGKAKAASKKKPAARKAGRRTGKISKK